MPVHDDLGIRMKTYYEQIPKTKLIRRVPVVIRIDGKAFHTFTRGFKKPFDRYLMDCMQKTMKALCENIQGCVLGYTQSDEITLILTDYKKLTSQAWFDYEVQKMCSIAASIATLAFNREFSNLTRELICDTDLKEDEFIYVQKVILKAEEKGALFDARCFNVPKEEVANLIYWRQLDATRNSIQMVGRANFSHRELQNKSCKQIQDMLMTEKGINWNEFAADEKRGSCCIKDENGWVIDREIPIFKGEGREYVEKLIRENNE
jgi:conserved hypothetical protein